MNSQWRFTGIPVYSLSRLDWEVTWEGASLTVDQVAREAPSIEWESLG